MGSKPRLSKVSNRLVAVRVNPGAAHPTGKVKVMKGKYGPYVSDGKLNATLPQGSDPASITMEEAVALLAARAAKGPGKKPARKAKAAAAPKQ